MHLLFNVRKRLRAFPECWHPISILIISYPGHWNHHYCPYPAISRSVSVAHPSIGSAEGMYKVSVFCMTKWIYMLWGGAHSIGVLMTTLDASWGYNCKLHKTLEMPRIVLWRLFGRGSPCCHQLGLLRLPLKGESSTQFSDEMASGAVRRHS